MGKRYVQHSDLCGCERCAIQADRENPQPVFDAVEDPMFSIADVPNGADATAPYTMILTRIRHQIVELLTVLCYCFSKEKAMDATKYCQCNNSVTANPCIVCGKLKFIDPAWLKRKIEEDGDEGEIGAGFEMLPLPVAPLWCVNVHGPDDVIATASYIDAVKMANAFNRWWQELRTQKPLHEFDARMWGVPIEWPHDAASHAAAVANPSAEYAYFIAGAA